MAQISVVSTQVEIQSPADMFYGFFKDKIPQLPQIFPDGFKSYNISEGNEIRDGVVVWGQYNLGGSILMLTAKVEVNDSCNSVSFIITEGDLLKHYKSFKVKYQVNSGGYVKVTFEFEKARESSPDPDAYVTFVSKIIKKFDDAYLSRA